MNSEQIAIFGHAFFDGTTLEYKAGINWELWDEPYCPNFSGGEWRIKPDDPGTEVWCTFRGRNGDSCTVVKGSSLHGEFALSDNYWTHIPSLDKEVTLP